MKRKILKFIFDTLNLTFNFAVLGFLGVLIIVLTKAAEPFIKDLHWFLQFLYLLGSIGFMLYSLKINWAWFIDYDLVHKSVRK